MIVSEAGPGAPCGTALCRVRNAPDSPFCAFDFEWLLPQSDGDAQPAFKKRTPPGLHSPEVC